MKLLAFFMLYFAAAPAALAATVNYAGMTPYVESITGFVFDTDTEARGVYDIAFVDGSFNDAYGASFDIDDLLFDLTDSFNIGRQLADFLTHEAPDALVASDVSAALASRFTYEGFLIPYRDDLFGDWSVLIVRDLLDASVWQTSGSFGPGRESTNARGICSGCTTKYAVFTKTSDEIPPVPLPAAAALFVPGLTLLAAMRRRRRA